jgi:predicted ATPase/DNA-binding winged helix-turn-helix (wHTH) protein/Tfp pilus assembly protein PilF
MELTLESCVINLDTRAVVWADKNLRLTATEVELLRYLAARPKEVVSREELYREVWKHRTELQTRTLDLAVLRLRKKIEQDPRNPTHVLTVYGSGYSFVPTGESVEVPITIDTPKQQTNLGREENEFFGREAEIASLDKLIQSRRECITVLGPPGTGKTRLVKHWGAVKLRSGVVDSAWFCDLTEARTAAGILHAVATSLGIPLKNMDSDISSLSKDIGRTITRCGSTLVLIDNAEQVIEVLAPLLRDWWEQAPDARFVLTSQVPLGLPLEQRFPLGPLPTTTEANEASAHNNPAVQLFVNRAKLVQPSFELTPANQTDIQAIVDTLDGLPLAIELAAARAHLMPPASLLKRLDDRFRLLRRPAAAGPSRHTTLRAALDWSWELLSPWEQSALAQCSVFRGGFDWAAVEAVVTLESGPNAPWAVDVVGELVNRSLCAISEVPEADGRLFLLASIAEYAAARLTESGDEAVQGAQKRHAEHYAHLGTDEYLASLVALNSLSRRIQLKLELQNVLAAFENAVLAADSSRATLTCCAAERVFRITGPFRDAVALIERALTLDHEVANRARLEYRLANAYFFMGRTPTAVEHSERALDLSREAQEPRLECSILSNMVVSTNDIIKGQDYFEQVQRLSKQFGPYPLCEGVALVGLGRIHLLNLGETQQALTNFSKAVALFRSAGHIRLEAGALGNLGLAHMRAWQADKAETYLTQALKLARLLQERPTQLALNLRLAKLYHQQGLFKKSVSRLSIAQSISTVLSANEDEITHTFGEVRLSQGHLDEAENRFQKVLDAHNVRSPLNLANAHRKLGALYRQQQQFENAGYHLDTALSLVPDTHQRTVALIHLEMGILDQAQDKLESSEEFFLKVLPVVHDFGDKASEGTTRGWLGLLHGKQGKFASAHEYLAQAAELLQELKVHPPLAHLWCQKGQVECLAGHADAARAALQQATALVQQLDLTEASELVRATSALEDAVKRI